MFILAVYFSQWQLVFLSENPTLLFSWLVAGTKEIDIFGSYHSQLEAKTFPMIYGMICCCKVFYGAILSQTNGFNSNFGAILQYKSLKAVFSKWDFLILGAKNLHFSCTHMHQTFQSYSELYSAGIYRGDCWYIIHSLIYIIFYT